MAAKTTYEYGIKPGDIFVHEFCSDGSDKASYYKVTRTSARFVTLVSIGAVHTGVDAIIPDPDRELGKPFRRKLQDHGAPGHESPCVGAEWYGIARPWDGSPSTYEY